MRLLLRRGTALLGGLAGIVLSAASYVETPRHPTTSAAPQKRALVIAIGDYPAGSLYSDLSSNNDIPLIRGALLHQGFDDGQIVVVSDSAATRAGIVAAIRSHLLAPAQAGDVLFLHYSGHGVRITDDDGDEPDGYDEALVPYDALGLRLDPDAAWNRAPGSGDQVADAIPEDVAASYVRDDELGTLVAELRRRVGPTGNVVVSIDACNSGSATRGLPIRGSPDPVGPPAPTARSGGPEAADAGSGLLDAGRGTSRGGGPEALAPYVVLAASRHDEPAREVRAEDGSSVGSLVLALSRALAEAGPGTSYRALFDRVKADMAVLVPGQTPQLEGDADTELFSGRALAQRPYVDVSSVRGDTAVVLDAGTLLSMQPGTEVGLYPSGTPDPDAATALATGQVISVTATRSLLRLDGPVPEGALQTWAFVTRYAPGELKVQVGIDPGVDGSLADEIRGELDGMAVAGIAEDQPDLVVIPASGARDAVELRTADDDRLLYGPTESAAPGLAGRLGGRVQAYARNRYLARIGLEDPHLDIRLEVVPARHRFDFDGSCIESDPIPRPESADGTEPLRFRPGDGYLLRLRNEGRMAGYVTVLSLAPDGSIVQLFPVPQLSGQDNYLEPDRSFLVDLCYIVEEPYGVEILKLFATRERVDFWPILNGAGSGRAVESMNPLERLLAEVQSGTRSSIAGPPRATGSTYAVTIHVER